VLTYNFNKDEEKKKVAQAPIKVNNSFNKVSVIIKARKAAKPTTKSVAKPSVVKRCRDDVTRGRSGRK
jgi:hypothetical protein